jgi:exopolysaccharide production protein ExoZ
MNMGGVASIRGIYTDTLARPVHHKGELLSVQRLRGVAVSMMLIVHLEDVSRFFEGSSRVASVYASRLGYSAADLFFVISGFIMAYITFTRPFDARSWAISRFIRIYPMYVMFSLLVVGLWLYDPRMTMGSGEQTWSRILVSLMGLPQADLPLLFVGWTVEHEILYYTVVFLTAHFLGRERLVPVMLFLSALAIGRWLLRISTGIDFWDYHIASPYMIQFTMGVLVFRWWDRLAVLGWKLPLATAPIFLLAGMALAQSGTINHEPMARIVLFGCGYSCVLLSVLNLEREQHASGRFQKRRDVLVWIGDASYSIYLSHAFVLGTFGKIFPLVGPSWAAQILTIIVAALAVMAVGLLTHIFIERRVMELGRVLSKPKRTGATSA